MNRIFPNYFTNKAIAIYILLLVLISALFIQQILPLHWIIFGCLEVFSFFYFSNLFTKKWKLLSEKTCLRKLFVFSLSIRLIYVIFTYFFYEYMTGLPFEFETGDALGYHEEAIWLKELIFQGQINSKFVPYVNGNYSDTGYPFYLSLLYMLIDNSILITRLIKAVLSAYTCVLIYKIAKNNFGESTGKIAGVLAMLFPSFIYYCGLHVKETEMIFLITLFIERADFFMNTGALNYRHLLQILFLAVSLFFFRTVVGISAIFALISLLVFYKNNLRQYAKRVVIGFWLILTVLIFIGSGIQNEITKYWEDKGSNQAQSLKARSEMESGNKFAKYGESAIFAPLMVIAPLPTLVNIETQQNQMMLNGGFYVKNIMGFFVLFALWYIYRNKLIKKHIFLVSFLLLYLGILTLSKFAISERFHMPVYPLLLIFAAYGISNINLKMKKYYVPYLVFIVLIILGWNLFKLAGRGEV